MCLAGLLLACHSYSKQRSSGLGGMPVSGNGVKAAALPPPVISGNGVYPPGEQELTAIQIRYADVTSEKLKAGHALYTAGACVGCHSAQGIYQYSETQWKTIMDDMAAKAQLTENEKDAVYKYVLAIKATQPKATQ